MSDIVDEKKLAYLRSLARTTCQRTGCTRPAIYAVVLNYACMKKEHTRHYVGSSLGACEECRPYFLEKILPELVQDLTARGIQPKGLQFELIKIEE